MLDQVLGIIVEKASVHHLSSGNVVIEGALIVDHPIRPMLGLIITGHDEQVRGLHVESV